MIVQSLLLVVFFISEYSKCTCKLFYKLFPITKSSKNILQMANRAKNCLNCNYPIKLKITTCDLWLITLVYQDSTAGLSSVLHPRTDSYRLDMPPGLSTVPTSLQRWLGSSPAREIAQKLGDSYSPLYKSVFGSGTVGSHNHSTRSILRTCHLGLTICLLDFRALKRIILSYLYV
jgi:hypothetical protein